MKYFELDKDEQDILQQYEKGKLKSIANFRRELDQYKLYAQAALDKTKNINIRISESDLLKIKSLAMRKGLPYQTMIASVIHQYSTGQIKNS